MTSLRRSAFAVALSWTAACGGDGTGPDASEIVVSPTPITLAQNQTAQLSVSVLDSDGSLVSGIAVTFRSNDESVITVSATGMITSVGKAGEAAVIVRAAGLTENVPVTVTATSSGITIGPNPAVVPQLTTLQLDATVTDAVGDPVPGAPITYTTSDATIATVSATGLVTAVGPAGQATVFARSGALVGQTAVVVTQVPTTLELGPDPLTLGVNESGQLSARVLDAVGAVVVGRPIVYAAAPASLLDVSTNGRVTSKGPLGSGTVTAASGDLEEVVDVDVVATARPAGTIRASVPLSGNPYGVAMTSDGKVLVVALNGTLYSAPLSTLSFTSGNTPSYVSTDVAVNPAGTRAWVSNAPVNGITEYDISGATPVALRSITLVEFGDLYGIRVSPDGSTVYVGSGDGSVFFVSTGTGAVLDEIQIGGGVVHLSIGEGGAKLYASLAGAGRVVEIDVATKATRNFTLASSRGQAVVTAVDDSELYVASEDGALEIFDLTTQARSVMDIGCGAYGIGITPDNTRLYIACASAAQVKIIDRGTHTILATLDLPGAGRRVAVAPNGLTVAVAVENGYVTIIE